MEPFSIPDLFLKGHFRISDISKNILCVYAIDQTSFSDTRHALITTLKNWFSPCSSWSCLTLTVPRFMIWSIDGRLSKKSAGGSGSSKLKLSCPGSYSFRAPLSSPFCCSLQLIQHHYGMSHQALVSKT